VKTTPKDRHKSINYSRPLFAAGLIASSLLHSMAPARSVTISSIDNQATASYEDPLNPPKTTDINDPRRINTVSNLIRITIDEVAGITVKQKGITDDKDANIAVVQGGDTVYFRFDLTNIGNDGTRIFVPNKAGLNGAGTLQRLQYFNDVNGWQDILDGGLISGDIPSNKVLKVRVPVKVNNGGSGNLSVSLGNTPTETNGQNIEIIKANIDTVKNSDRVFTIDNNDTVDEEIPGAPGNGTREAMDTQTITIGKQPQTFATIKISDGSYVVADRSITYNLNVKVENTVPDRAGNVVPADMVGLTIPGLKEPGILLSDAIPVGTKFDKAVAPTGWTIVYQYGNAISPTDRADTSTWSTTPPEANPNETLRRVGFILPNGRIPKGNIVDGFQLKLTVIDPFTTTQVNNLAQLFGNSPANPNDSTDKTPNPNLPVVDESGDLNPNDFNANGAPGPTDPVTGKPLVKPGIGDVTAIIGKFTITPISVGKIVNGTKGSPDAVGEGNDNNRDFTNKSIITPVEAGSTLNPAIIGFTNTVKNQTGVPLDIKIIPTIKAGETLPDDTIVTLRDPKKVIADVTFKVKGGKLVANDAAKPTFVIPQVGSQQTVEYITGIDLPDGTDALKGYAVELVAFVDRNNDNLVDPDELTNKTTDRVYTGFISAIKESRVLDADNKTVLSDFSADTKSKLAKPGQYIEYRLTFKNISPIVPDGSGSKGLSASNFTIIEDGYASPNNWAGLTEHDPNSAIGDVGTVTAFSRSDKMTTTTIDRQVTKYTHTIGTLAPEATGTFIFRRQVSK
jgi:hypothetical protein